MSKMPHKAHQRNIAQRALKVCAISPNLTSRATSENNIIIGETSVSNVAVAATTIGGI